ncbi:MAG: hypothetical protein KC731_32515 [Myxococcales bacterium]|nr:hypothetical protein [Myxococcales bacterium]
MDEPLDLLGRFIMKHLRDPGIHHVEHLLVAKWKAPALRDLQQELRSLSPEQRTLVRRAVVSSLDAAIHDFLFALQEASENGAVRILVDGNDPARESDGLHGELFSEDGWCARFSEYGEPTDD